MSGPTTEPRSTPDSTPDPTPDEPRRRELVWGIPLLGIALVIALTWWMSGRTGDEHRAWPALVLVLVSSAPYALLWLTAAHGFGWLVRQGLRPVIHDAIEQAAAGVATLLVMDAALGRAGALQVPWLAWVVLAVGVAAALHQAWRWVRRVRSAPARRTDLPAAALLSLAPALAALLVASCSAPGWLWPSEFGGYDVLSYHLQLPHEWLAGGRIAGLEHNVYSHLPSYVEAAWYHLAVLVGDAPEAAAACQLLHAAIAVLGAVAVGRIAARLVGRLAGALATVMVLATPWAIVVGSLAYDEMVVVLLLAGGMSMLIGRDADDGGPVRRGLAVGLLAGVACGAKLTAAGFVAMPLAVLLVLDGRSASERLRAAAAAGVVALATLAPYLVGNALHTGNPVFPFATGLLGAGHWTAEQAAIWSDAHQPSLGVAERVTGLWNQLMRYGIGRSPDPREPWDPLWSVLPWMALAAIAVATLARSTRRNAVRITIVLVMQLAFWLAFTHVKSRFMVPALVPASILVALASGVAVRGALARVVPVLVAILVILMVAWGASPFVLLPSDRPLATMIGATDLFTGAAHARQLDLADLTAAERGRLLDGAPPTLWVNHLLAPAARVLLVGEARALYYRPDRIVYQTTWDRGPMSAVMRRSDAPSTWMQELAAEGISHILVDPTMLRVWEQSGWNDPMLTAERVLGAARDHATVVRAFGDGSVLFELPPVDVTDSRTESRQPSRVSPR